MIVSDPMNPVVRKPGLRRRAKSRESSGATPRRPGILLVDDQASLRRLLNLALQQEGFVLWLAANGQEALELYRRHHRAIDVVLLDVRMPGLDGPQTMTALQELNPQIRCCFMSGDLGSLTEARLQDLGAAAVFLKPFDLAEVAQVLGQVASAADLSPASLSA